MGHTSRSDIHSPHLSRTNTIRSAEHHPRCDRSRSAHSGHVAGADRCHGRRAFSACTESRAHAQRYYVAPDLKYAGCTADGHIMRCISDDLLHPFILPRLYRQRFNYPDMAVRGVFAHDHYYHAHSPTASPQRHRRHGHACAAGTATGQWSCNVGKFPYTAFHPRPHRDQWQASMKPAIAGVSFFNI